MISPILLRVLTLLLGTATCVALLSASVTQEVPHGGIHIVVTMKENGKPLPKAWVVVSSKNAEEEIDVPATSVTGDELQPMHRYNSDIHRYKTDANGEISASNLAEGTYTVECNGRAHQAKRQLLGIGESKTTELHLELAPIEPYLDLYASQRVFTPDDKPSFGIKGFDRSPSVNVRYYKLDLAKIVEKGGLSTLLYSFSRPGNEGASDPTRSASSVGQFDKTVGKDVEGITTEKIEMPKLSEGFYYVTCSLGRQTRATYLNISTIGLVTKTSGADALCYVADLVSGKSVAGAAIEVPSRTGLQKVATTDRFGLAKLTVPHQALKKALIFAMYGKSQAVLDFDNEPGKSEDTRIFMYSDRPIYRPGDKVQFKGIVRKLQGLAYGVPPGGQIQIEIRDADETAIQRFALPLSAKGTFNGSFTSNSEDKPGVYSIHATYAGAEDTYWVNLAAYRKPEFSIRVTPNRKFYVYGDRASATVKAEYYFGGPVVGAKVEAYVTRSAHYSYDVYADEEAVLGPDEGGDSGGYYEKEFQGEYDEKVEVTTNEKGEAVVQFDTKTEGDPEIPDYDLDYSVNASITDAGNKVFEGTGDVPVMRGDVSADLSTDRYIADPGDTVSVSVRVKREDNGAPVSGRDVSLLVGTENWDNNKAEFVQRGVFSGRTDGKGMATIPVKVGDEGSLVLKATVKDDAGRPVKAVDYLYVEGDRIFGPPAQKFAVTLDKRSYHVGDKCKVLVETNKPGGSALVTVQAEKVFASYVVNLPKAATTLTLPVLHSYAPNVWVSVTAIRNKQLLEAESRLVVDLKEHDLKIAITPDRPDYQPGDTANLTIKTTGADGKPVAADLSVGVVDESIYAIKPDTTNIKRAFYPMRQDDVHTNYSFEDIYLDGGDKAGGNIPVRTKFEDTASWQPTVETDSSGTARTSIKLPDNLTSWRATAIGVTAATQVGLTHVNFRARKPLSVRLELPAFLVQQDTQKITAIVTNDTGQDQDVNVRLEAQGVHVNGDLSMKMHVSAARPLAITWNVDTPQSGAAKLTARAWTDGERFADAEGRSLTIEPHGRLLVETHSGEVKSDSKLTFNVSPRADPTSGRLLVTISPSIGCSIYQSLDELIAFPYGCTEQTMSRFLPTVVLSSTLKEQNIRSDLQAKVPDIVANGFARLARMQHSNGAWGWWEYDGEDPFMTAYVLDGLKRAKDAGFTSDRINDDQALKWAKNQMKDAKIPEYGTRDFLYLCYAVALYGGKAEAQEGIARVTPKSGSDFALLALTYDKLGDAGASREALAKLHDLIRVEGDIAQVKGEGWEYGAESMAFPLIALTTLIPQDPVIPKLVRYLMAERRGDMWNSTRDTSLALIGLTQYMKITRDSGKPVDIDLVLNGGPPKRIHFDPADQFNPGLKITYPISALKPGPNTIEFRRALGTTAPPTIASVAPQKWHGRPARVFPWASRPWSGGEAVRNPDGTSVWLASGRTQAPEGICYFAADLRQIEVADRLLPLADTIGLSIQRNYYLLEPQQMENGGLELRPTKRGIDTAKSGDIIRVELTIASSTNREFIMVEDPIPSGCRITEREYLDSGETWGYWWSQTIVRDDKAAFFMRYLPKGVQKLTYTMRAEQIGQGHALPPTLSNMYDPAESASGAESRLQVNP